MFTLPVNSMSRNGAQFRKQIMHVPGNLSTGNQDHTVSSPLLFIRVFANVECHRVDVLQVVTKYRVAPIFERPHSASQ